MKLEGKVAIVTGSGRGIGREIALAYAEEGAKVAVLARTISQIEAVAEEIRALGRRVLAIPTDVGMEEQVNRMVQQTLAEFGRIDILVNNAGGTLGVKSRPVWEISLGEWRAVLDANVTGAFLCCKAVVPQMIKQRSGSIINVTSGMGKVGRKNYGVYSVAKFGMEGLTQALAEELAEFNVRVNALRPGGSTATYPVLQQPNLDLKTVARPDIVRPLALFLASDESIGTTGQSIDCREWNPKYGFGDLSQYLYSPPKK